jgi:PHD/YefM family antitoxin component YafN of YafNO toxin-antitoxin module
MTNLIQNEAFTSVQKAQAGLTKLLKEATRRGVFYRVMRNNEPIGVLMPNTAWETLLEDIEASQSKSYRRAIATARKDKKAHTRTQVKKRLGL